VYGPLSQPIVNCFSNSSIVGARAAPRTRAKTVTRTTQDWKGTLLNSLGWTYFNIVDFDTALTTFDSALDFQKEAADPVRIRVALDCGPMPPRVETIRRGTCYQNDLIHIPSRVMFRKKSESYF
jgi:hypothetical protein